MKRILLSLSLLMVCLCLQAQERYLDPSFDVQVTENVVYGENYEVLTGAPILIDLVMDVYEPEGDTEERRPLVVMAHAGSFLPKGLNTLPFGNRRDSTNIEMCREFAARGYVCASIDYRLGWNPLAPTQESRAISIIQATYRASQDMVTAVRYFAQDAATDNTYRTDSTRVIVAGNNSGGYMALTAAYLNRPEELELFKFLDSNGDPFVDTELLGNMDGTGGTAGLHNYSNQGYSTDIHMVLNLGGAIGDLFWIDDTDEAALVSFQEVNNPLTPYATAVVIVTSTGDPIIEVSGGGAIHPHITDEALGLNDALVNATFDDPYTEGAETAAMALNSTYQEGLYSITSPVFFYDPWAWYDPSDPNIDNTTPGASGSGSAANPFNTPESARIYIDTVMGYFNPRACVQLGLPCADNFTSTKEVVQNVDRLTVFPNPAAEQFMLTSKQADRLIQGFDLYNLSGQLITQVDGLNDQQVRVEVPHLSPGMYLVNVRFEDGIVPTKVMIE